MKYQKSCISLIILLIFLCDYISCILLKPRLSHATALINNKLYIFSEAKIAGDPNNSNFFFVDLSDIPFPRNINYNSEHSRNNLILPSINNNNITCFGTTAVAGGVNNTSFILFGGRLSPDNSKDNNNLVLSFDTITNTWSRPNITGIPPKQRTIRAVINNYNGKVYIFGGSTSPSFTYYNTDYPKSTFYNDMIILDTINWTWDYGSNVNAPSRRNDFSVVMLPSGIIVYIGGSLPNGNYVGMDQVFCLFLINVF